MIRTTSFTTSATPQKIVDASRTSVNNPKLVIVQNADGTNGVRLGGTTRGGPGADLLGGAAYTLATSGANTGFLLAANSSISMTLGPGDDLWALANAGTPVVIVLETQTN